MVSWILAQLQATTSPQFKGRGQSFLIPIIFPKAKRPILMEKMAVQLSIMVLAII